MLLSHKTVFILSFLFCLVESSAGQDTLSIYYPEGAYSTLQDLLDKHARIIPKIRKVNLAVPNNLAMADTLVDHCFFINADHDIIKKTFAVSYKNQLYFSEYGIKRLSVEGYSTRGMAEGYQCHRVQDWGRYLYMTITYIPTNTGEVLVMGALFGALGVLAAGGGQSGLVETPLIFDTKSNKCYGLHTQQDLKLFMKSHYPDYPFNADLFKEPGDVRNLIVQLNTLAAAK